MKSSRIDQFVDGVEPDFAPISLYGGGSWYGGGDSIGFGWFDCSGKSCLSSLCDFELVGRGWGWGYGVEFSAGIGYGTGTASGSGHCPGG